MSSQELVIGNLNQYIKHHLRQEGKTGTYTLSSKGPVQGVWGQTIETWNVPNLSQPSFSDLAVYSENDVFAINTIKNKLIQQIDFTQVQDVKVDYKALRDKLKIMYPESDWDSYSLEEQQLLAKSLIIKDLRKLSTVLDESEIQQWSIRYNENMRSTRRKRYDRVVYLLYHHMGSVKAKNILVTIIRDSLHDLYQDGIESKTNDGYVGIRDYFLDLGPYKATGFSSQGAPQTNRTNKQIQQTILDIL